MLFDRQKILVWFYNMPLLGMNMDMAFCIGGKVGQVIDVDLGSSGLSLGRYLRIRVVVNLMKPLRRTMGLVVNPDKASITMLLMYEKLPYMFMNCGPIEHTVGKCLFLTIEALV